MKREEIEKIFRTLALSQGLYGRILRDIYSASPEEQNRIWEELENQHFVDVLDLIMFIEG